MQTISDKIRLKQMELNVEREPNKRAGLQRELQRLQIKQKIEALNKQLDNLG